MGCGSCGGRVKAYRQPVSTPIITDTEVVVPPIQNQENPQTPTTNGETLKSEASKLLKKFRNYRKIK